MWCCLYNKLVEIRKTAPTVCPTWPEQALRANILAQISLALNRIWTEWYPSRGYSFNITGSPGVDQAYVSGRTVFAVMEKLTAELFNTYVRRSGDREPYYTEYCDGKTVTCPGMKQWGTVDRAKEGKSALQILRYYYGSRVELVTTNNIASHPVQLSRAARCGAAAPAPTCASSSGSFPALPRITRSSASPP